MGPGSIPSHCNNGSQITASRKDRTTTRNSVFFKLFRCDDDVELVEHTASLQKPSITASTDTVSPSNPVSPEPAQVSIFVEPGEELDTAIQRQVSFNDEIVVINNDVDNEIEAHVEPSPAITPTPIIAPKPNKPTAKLGRPTKEESAIKEQNRIMLEQERRAINPPPRASTRIATQNPRGGKM